MKPVLREGRNCWLETEATQSAVLVDGATYYTTFYRAAELAQHTILLCGWQFDSTVQLLRGAEAERAERPTELIAFLDHLCLERPELRIYMLAWDYSFVYALEREWMQALKFRYATSERLRFEFDSHPATGGSHHQKFVVIDGQIAFAGGMDICESRWDERDHRTHNALRVDRTGKPYKPYHDVQVGLTGPTVRQLEALFAERWRRACGETLDFASREELDPARFDLTRLSDGAALPIRRSRLALSLTQVDASGETLQVRQIRTLYEDAIRAADELVYIETQYFTSRAVARALIQRMQEPNRPKLQILIVMPYGADTPKEKFALGDTQNAVLATLLEAALATGHQVRLLYSASADPEGIERPTFIHSKLLIVDDLLLSVGSANLTNRSMGFDSELNVTWECASTTDPLNGCIRHVRSSLLAEHIGLADPSSVGPVQGLVERIDAYCADPRYRLRRRLLPPPEQPDPWLCAVFDPDGPGAFELDPDERFGADQKGFFARGIEALGERLAKGDTRSEEPSA